MTDPAQKFPPEAASGILPKEADLVDGALRDLGKIATHLDNVGALSRLAAIQGRRLNEQADAIARQERIIRDLNDLAASLLVRVHDLEEKHEALLQLAALGPKRGAV